VICPENFFEIIPISQLENGTLLFMKTILSLLTLFWIMTGCSTKTETYQFSSYSKSTAVVVSYEALQGWRDEELSPLLEMFRSQCTKSSLPILLHQTCDKAMKVTDVRGFFESEFVPVALRDFNGESIGLMTGYFEPLLKGSLSQSDRYSYPIYGVPKELVTIKLESIHPELRGKKLRGRVEKGKIVPLPSRQEINKEHFNAPVICYVESDIERFFLQVQGSGRVQLESGKTLFLGYENENGHPYRSIGKAMIEMGYINEADISLQSIRTWLQDHPEQRSAMLEHNPSFVFFARREQGATGSLGLKLTPLHSIAVDRSYIPLGMPVYYRATDPLTGEALHHLALAQDTGGAIKGQVRADLFWGFGKEAEVRAGAMKSTLELWILVPKRLIESKL